MVIAIIVSILLVVAILATVGAYIVVSNSNKEKENADALKIAMSGKYAAAMRPIADSLAERKPSKTEIEEWLNSQSLSEEQKKSLMESWQNSIDKTIKTIEEGDTNGVTAYRIEFGAKDEKLCRFLHKGHFITRAQINKYAEILPPYYPGSDSTVVPKQPWENSEATGGWQSVMPKDGRYEVPEWRQITPIENL